MALLINRIGLIGVLLLLCWRAFDWFAATALDAAVDNKPRSLQQRLWDNPSSAADYLRLAERGGAADADHLVSLGERMAPRELGLRLAAAAYWARRGRYEDALRNWDSVLRLEPQFGADLYPLLLAIAEDNYYSDNRSTAFNALSSAPWWPAFFRYAAEHADLRLLRALFRRSEQSGALQPRALRTVRDSFLNRLIDEKRWRETYFIWLNDVGRNNLTRLSNLYNGSFETALSQSGYGWHAPPVDGVEVSSEFGEGVQGEKALRLRFNTAELRYRHLYQYLLLPPGRYRLSGLARASALKSGRGLQWFVRCENANRTALGQSSRFNSDLSWQLFQVEFHVPDFACDVQQLRLETVEPQGVRVSGDLWFDDLKIKRLGGYAY